MPTSEAISYYRLYYRVIIICGSDIMNDYYQEASQFRLTFCDVRFRHKDDAAAYFAGISVVDIRVTPFAKQAALLLLLRVIGGGFFDKRAADFSHVRWRGKHFSAVAVVIAECFCQLEATEVLFIKSSASRDTRMPASALMRAFDCLVPKVRRFRRAARPSTVTSASWLISMLISSARIASHLAPPFPAKIRIAIGSTLRFH